METSRLKAALLDFDGTLVDLPVDWERVREQVTQLFAEHGISGEFRPLQASADRAFAELVARGVPSERRAVIRRRLNRLMTDAELAAAGAAAALPGSRELLDRLRDRGWRTMIQTSNSVRAVRKVWDRLSLPAVDAVVGRESARRLKPNPEGVRRSLRDLGLLGSDCVVVGDGDFDVALGRAIGARTVRVTNGEAPPVTGVEADIEVGSLKEVIALVVDAAGAVA